MLLSTLSLGLIVLPFVSAATHHIKVGQGGLNFEPFAIGAEIGDDVIFEFVSKNHTVTQTSFGQVCEPKEGGIDSGFMPVQANSTYAPPTFTLQVTTKEPLWFYCRQAAGTPNDHCGKGMVFSINCPPDGEKNSFPNFKKAALEFGASLATAAPTPTPTPAGGYGGSYGGAAYGDPKVVTGSYGTVTIPGEPKGVVVTAAVTLGESSWATTYTSYPNSPAPTPASADGGEIIVKVGEGGLKFDPPFIMAPPRTKVKFQFAAKNHTVTQSTFENPCASKPGGIDSGFKPVDASATSLPEFTMTVNDTEPHWFFCGQANHCEQGMVFAINPDETSERNHAAFSQLAKTIGTNAAASAAPPTTSTNSGLTATRFGGSGLAVVALVATLLF
jgi:plastocyanin